MSPRLVGVLLLLSAMALGALVLVARAREDQRDSGGLPAPSRFEGATFPGGVRVPDFSLENQDGERVTMRELRGKPVIVTFLYTTCRESCPAQAQTVKGAMNELGHDVPALAIAVDPPRDTPERARAFLSKQRMTGRMDFLLGSRAQLRRVWNDFKIQPQSARQEHQAHIILVDRRGLQRIGFPVEQATPERLAHDVRMLEREQ